MPGDNRNKKLVYHLTSATNLATIAGNGLLSRAELRRRGIRFDDVADPSILLGRLEYGLDECVPFHFMTLNPFDYAVVNKADHDRFVLFAVHRATARSADWRVIPKHPLANGGAPEILEWDTGIDRIDWH